MIVPGSNRNISGCLGYDILWQYTCIFIQAIHIERDTQSLSHESWIKSFNPFFTPLHKDLTDIEKLHFVMKESGNVAQIAFSLQLQNPDCSWRENWFCRHTHTTDIESLTLTFCFRQIWLWHVEHGFHWKSCKCALCRIHLWLQGERKPLRSYVDSFDQCTFASLNNKHFLGIQRATQCFSISKIIGS